MSLTELFVNHDNYVATRKELLDYRAKLIKDNGGDGDLDAQQYKEIGQKIFPYWERTSASWIKRFTNKMLQLWFGLPLVLCLGMWYMIWFGRASSKFDCVLTPQYYIDYIGIDGLLSSSTLSMFSTAVATLAPFIAIIGITFFMVLELWGRWLTKKSTLWQNKKRVIWILIVFLAVWSLDNVVKDAEVPARTQHSVWMAEHNLRTGTNAVVARCINAREVRVGKTNKIVKID